MMPAMDWHNIRFDYVALVGSVLALCGWMLWNIAKRSVTRSNSEGDLDTRVVKMIEVSVQPLKDVIALQTAIINEERSEKQHALAEVQRITEKFFKFADDATKAHDAKVDKLAERLHGRVDKCEEEHRQARREGESVRLENAELKRRLEALESRQYQTALATPAIVPTGHTVHGG